MLRKLALLGLLGAGLPTAMAVAICGDGMIEAGEQCDDGNTVSGDSCSATCQFEGCPVTGIWTGGVGPFVLVWLIQEDESGGLHGYSYPPSGVRNGIHTGTRSGAALTFTAVYTFTGTMPDCDTMDFPLSLPMLLTRGATSICGDGTTDGFEECDDGNAANGDACSQFCTVPVCGNVLVEGGEECDDGNLTDGDGCSAACRACGNGTLDAGEQCDDGNRLTGDGCSPNCLNQQCGNGAFDDGEQCDDGNATAGDGCSATCQFEGCSLSGVWADALPGFFYVLRDDAGIVSGYSFPLFSPPTASMPISGSRAGTDVTLDTPIGTYAGTMAGCDLIPLPGLITQPLRRLSSGACGDGLLALGEECDDGNQSDLDQCTNVCTLPDCGNVVLDPGEQCDDGNTENGDGCDTNCTLPACGNRLIDPGEQCDDGDAAGGCAATCTLPGCGNGQPDPGEQCDDGNLVDDDGCARNCRVQTCGNGIVEAFEQCDDGNLAPCDGCGFECERELDDDGDRVVSPCDNCGDDYNPGQHDRDSNGVGDACDAPLNLSTPAGAAVAVNGSLAPGTGLAPSAARALAITYPTVSTPGVTSVTPLETPANGILEANFQVSELGALLHIDTTATFAGAIDLCVTYDDALLSPAQEATLQLLNEEDGVFVDRTASLDTEANVLCGQVAHFSTFALGRPVEPLHRLRLIMHRPLGASDDAIDRLVVRFPASGLDPTVTGLQISLLRDGTRVFRRTVDAALWQRNAAGTTFSFSDPTGVATDGMTEGTLRLSRRGKATLRLSGAGLDLGGVNPATLAVRIDIGSATAAASSRCRTRQDELGERVRCTR